MLGLKQKENTVNMQEAEPVAKVRPVVAVDVDGTLANVHAVMVKLVNEEKGTHYTWKDIKSYSPPGIDLGITPDEFHKKYVDAWTNHWREIPPMADSSHMARLAKVADVYILTGMDPELVHAFKKWLRFYFPEVAEKVSICTVEEMKCKLSWGFTALIDDAADIGRRDLGHRLDIMPTQPHNLDVKLGPETIRVSCTNEGIDLFLRVEGR